MTKTTRLDMLTEREKEPLRLWLQHKTAKEIALELGVSHHAVEKRLRMARTKLGVASSLEAARLLQEAEGYGQPAAQTTDLSQQREPHHASGSRTIIAGAFAVSLIAATFFALSLQDQPEIDTVRSSNQIVEIQDEELAAALSSLIAAAEIGASGEVFLARPVGDQRYLKAGSGYYWQISGGERDPFTSRSLWDRTLEPTGKARAREPFYYESDKFAREPLRMVEQRVRLPGSDVEWIFIVARPQARAD